MIECKNNVANIAADEKASSLEKELNLTISCGRMIKFNLWAEYNFVMGLVGISTRHSV